MRPPICRWPARYWCRSGGPAPAGPARKEGRKEGRPPDDQRGDLRPGVVCPAEEGPDDRVQTTALRAHGAQNRLEVPAEWVSRARGIPARRWSAPPWMRCGTWPAQGCVDVILCYSPDRLAR